jgi:predicted phage terminase large subunit-like protein
VITLAERVSPKMTDFILHVPTEKQWPFLLLPHLEALYGGAAGGGKSDALLMAALQYVDLPGYAAILFRRSYADLSLPGALMDRAGEWLGGTTARWSGPEKRWTFPSGATLTFGYLETEDDRYRYQSAEFQSIGFDELTQFSESQYRYLFSRLRRLEGSVVPLRMRAASNPGGRGHDWVKRRFLDEGRQAGRVFIPATLADNPHLDREEYERSLAELDPITRQQLLHGDWSARQGGTLLRREHFEVVEEAPAGIRALRFWDLAATEVKRSATKDASDPDYTAGPLVGLHNGVWYIMDMRRDRLAPQGVDNLVEQTAAMDGHRVAIRMEQEPGASGKAVIDHYARRILVGYDFKGVPSSGSKVERARPLSAASAAGNVKLVAGPWIGAFLDEADAFPMGSHDDQIDAVSGAMAQMSNVGLPRVTVM